MAVIDDVGIEVNSAYGLGDDFLDWFRGLTSNKMWKWFDENKETVVVEVKVWFLRLYKVRVKVLKPLFEWLFGDKP
jgi:hypothetical protein